MNNSKPFYLSLTIVGALVHLFITFASIFGVDLSDQVGAITNTITQCTLAGGALLATFSTIVGRIRASKQITLGRTPPSVNSLLLLGLATGAACVLMTGCAGVTGSGTIPSQFTNATPPLSSRDMAIVKQLTALDTSAALATIETSSATLTSIGMYVGIKQSATMSRDGLLLNGVGKVLQSPQAGTIPSANAVGNIVSGLAANAADTQSANNFTTLAQSLNGVTGLINTQINNLASQANNPSVAAYAAKVGEDVIAAVGKGICDATNQYATSGSAPVAAPAATTAN